MEVLAQLLLATHWLLCTGPLAAAYVLKKEQMAGNGDIPSKMCDAQIVQHWRGHPKDVTRHVQFLLDTIGDVMLTNNRVKEAIKHFFNVESIEVLCVDVKKEARAKAKLGQPEIQPDKFVSPLCGSFIALINVLQYDESKYTRRAMLSLDVQTDIMHFLEEPPWILKMPLDHRATSKALTAKEKGHKG